MSQTQLIEELTDICVRQAEIIKAQAEALAQYEAQVREDEIIASRTRLSALIGDLP